MGFNLGTWRLSSNQLLIKSRFVIRITKVKIYVIILRTARNPPIHSTDPSICRANSQELGRSVLSCPRMQEVRAQASPLCLGRELGPPYSYIGTWLYGYIVVQVYNHLNRFRNQNRGRRRFRFEFETAMLPVVYNAGARVITSDVFNASRGWVKNPHFLIILDGSMLARRLHVSIKDHHVGTGDTYFE